MKGRDDESEFYREIIRRAKRVRELAAESLRLSRSRARGKENVGAAPAPRAPTQSVAGTPEVDRGAPASGA